MSFLLIEPIINSVFIGEVKYLLHFLFSLLTCLVTDKFNFSTLQSVITCFLIGVLIEMLNYSLNIIDIYYNIAGISVFLILKDIAKAVNK
jgi:hypothetical protein